MSKPLRHLLIFPDYCSTGLWGIYDDDGEVGESDAVETEYVPSLSHVSINLEDLPSPLHPLVVDKLNILNKSYDLFGYPFTDQDEKTITTEESFFFMVYEIYHDIRRLNPQLTPLLLEPHYLARAFANQPAAHLHVYQKGNEKVLRVDLNVDPLDDMIDQGFLLYKTMELHASKFEDVME